MYSSTDRIQNVHFKMSASLLTFFYEAVDF
jgi:hypothetical protein